MNNTDGVNNSAESGMSDALDTAHDVPEVSTPTGDLVSVTTPGEIATTETAETQHSESGKQPAKQPKQPKKPRPTVQGSFAGGTWLALIAGCLLLILLLIFILQNQQSAELNFFSWHFQFPSGVGFLLSAIAGALIMALVGGVRMLELRRQVKKEKKLLASRDH